MLLTSAWAVSDSLQPRPYSPIRQTMSVLAGHAGTYRWIMTGALFAAGACYILTAVGMIGVRLAARLLLIVAGTAAIGIATSPEPLHGSTDQHLAWTALGALTIAIWPVFVARRTPRPFIVSVKGAGWPPWCWLPCWRGSGSRPRLAASWAWPSG